jgi:hypothetical protein
MGENGDLLKKGTAMTIKEILLGIWKVISFIGRPAPPGTEHQDW